MGVALVFALSGVLHLSWAFDAYSQNQAALAAQQKPSSFKSSPRPYDGELNGTSKEEAEDSPLSEELEEETIGSFEEVSGVSQASEPAPSIEGPSFAPAQAPAAAPQATTIHHTKYLEKPVYRIVHHQVSVAREVFEHGRPRIEWSLCPVCSKRHDAAYNERILDRVDQVFCTACGERHGSDYDETVYQ